MKNIISLLAVAALAVTFAAGCGSKRPDCAKLDKDNCTKGDEAALVCTLNNDKCEALKDDVVCGNQKEKAKCEKAAGLLSDDKKTCEFKNDACAIADKK